MLKIYTDLKDAQRTILNRRKMDAAVPDSLKHSLAGLRG